MIALKPLRPVLLLLGLGLATLNAQATPDARAILEQVEAQQRELTDSVYIKSRLSSCQYGINQRRIRCADQPRVTELESVGINLGNDGRDTQSISLVLSPPAEKGVGMLHHAYDDAGRDNETWIYLSALGQVKRIASDNSDDESEPASLFGSEFTTEDLDAGKLDEYAIQLLGEETLNERPVWKIETRPLGTRANKTRYARSVLFVDKDRLLPLRIELYDRQDREIKRMLANRVEQVHGLWLARSLTMLNLQTQRLSNLLRLGIAPDMDIAEAFISQRTLTDAAFRETQLAQLRAQIQ